MNTRRRFFRSLLGLPLAVPAAMAAAAEPTPVPKEIEKKLGNGNVFMAAGGDGHIVFMDGDGKAGWAITEKGLERVVLVAPPPPPPLVLSAVGIGAGGAIRISGGGNSCGGCGRCGGCTPLVGGTTVF